MRKSGLIFAKSFASLFLLIAASCSKQDDATNSGATTDKYDAGAAEIVSETPREHKVATLDCDGSDKDKGQCKAFIDLDEAIAELDGYGAVIGLDMLGAKYVHSKSNGLGGEYQSYIDRIELNLKNVVSDLGGMKDSGIQDAASSIKECIDILNNARKLSHDDYSLREDQCTLHGAHLVRIAKIADHVSGIVDTPDFNNVHWGDGIQTVEDAIAGKPITKNESSIVYRQTLGTHPAILAFHFTDGKLSSAVYWISEDHSEPSAYLGDFDDLDKLLIDKYGKPYHSRMSWVNSLFQNDPSHYGIALAAGQMRKDSIWDLKTMNITHAVYGDNFKVKHGIEYSSKEYAWSVRQAAMAQASSAL
jgi:hypothetical protein